MLQQLPREKKHLELAVVHCAAPEDAAAIRDMIPEIAPQARVEIRELGPALSTHCGPGLVGIGFWAHD